jgi:hypothetical protein
MTGVRWRRAVKNPYASITWIRFLGRRRSRVALSAFVSLSETGWLPE